MHSLVTAALLSLFALKSTPQNLTPKPQSSHPYRYADKNRGTPTFLWSPNPMNQLWFSTNRQPYKLKVFSPHLRSESQTLAYNFIEDRLNKTKKFLPLPSIEAHTKGTLDWNIHIVSNINEFKPTTDDFNTFSKQGNIMMLKNNKISENETALKSVTFGDVKEEQLFATTTSTAFEAVQNLISQCQISYATTNKVNLRNKIDLYGSTDDKPLYEKLTHETPEQFEVTFDPETESTSYPNTDLSIGQVSKVDEDKTNSIKKVQKHKSFNSTANNEEKKEPSESQNEKPKVNDKLRRLKEESNPSTQIDSQTESSQSNLQESKAATPWNEIINDLIKTMGSSSNKSQTPDEGKHT